MTPLVMILRRRRRRKRTRKREKEEEEEKEKEEKEERRRGGGGGGGGGGEAKNTLVTAETVFSINIPVDITLFSVVVSYRDRNIFVKIIFIF